MKDNKIHGCHDCEHCIYVGEGGFVCDLTYDVVMDEWEPTEEFYQCKGKEWVEE